MPCIIGDLSCLAHIRREVCCFSRNAKVKNVERLYVVIRYVGVNQR